MTSFQVARFGNKANAHDVLGHSGIPKDILTTMVWRTDAPPNSEELNLEPFVAAYLSGDYYVLQATSVDADAPRAGMVVTTAVVVPLADLATLDVRALWNAIADGVAVEHPLNGDDFLLDDSATVGHVHAPGSKAAASALFEHKRVVWMGAGFEDFVECLWLHLDPDGRARLVVAAAGHPERIPIPSESNSLTVVKSGEPARNLWHGWNAASQSSEETADAVRDAVFGDDDGRAKELAVGLDLVPSSVDFHLWRHLANAAESVARLRDLDHRETRALLQLMGLVQPDPSAGIGLKGQAVDRLRELTAEAGFADIRGLRGVPWPSLEPGALDGLIARWAKAVVLDPSRMDEILDAGADVSGASDEFMATVGRTLASCLLDDDVARVCAAALASELGPRALAWLVGQVRPASAVDEVLTAALTAGAVAPGWLAETARALRLPVTLAACLPVSDAVAAWTTLTKWRYRTVKAEDLLEKRTGPSGVVEAALASKDAKLVGRASKAVAADVRLLPGGSVEDDAFRALWFAAAKAGADPWLSVRPSDAVGPLLDILVAGEFVEPEVLTSLSATTSADISAHGSRKDLWSKFPPGALKGFLEATAGSIARSFQRGDGQLESQLSGAVLAAPVLGAVAEESAGQALVLLEGIPSARATDAIVVANHGRFTSAESTAFGALVKARNWRPAAEAIISLSASRTDLTNAAHTAAGMFNLFDRLAQIISSGSPIRPTVSINELRSSVTEVAATLYPSGPMSDGVWERSGGEAADLAIGTSTGRLAWGHAIEASMSGRRGAPSVKDLVAVMIEDYPKNAQLKVLMQAVENGSPA